MQSGYGREIKTPNTPSRPPGTFPKKPYVCCSPATRRIIYGLTSGRQSAVSTALFSLRGNFDALKFIAINALTPSMGREAIMRICKLAEGGFKPWTPAAEKVRGILSEVAINSTNEEVRKAASSRIWDMKKANPEVDISAILVSSASPQKGQISSESFKDGLMDLLD
ncbi:hypothetical protein JW721_02435 [Candidatus Micrarchaeota archaeon]|nr:hypothetical protein [Candidatus Micrarchaeota archaeon]